jgi:hypothetical protein
MMQEIPQYDIEELDYVSDLRDVIYADYQGKKILQKKYADEDTLVSTFIADVFLCYIIWQVEDMRIWRDNK